MPDDETLFAMLHIWKAKAKKTLIPPSHTAVQKPAVDFSLTYALSLRTPSVQL